jgi:hypothetical protein
MTPLARLTAAVLALAACLLLPAAASAGTITGRVTDEISGAPVENLEVGATGPGGGGLQDYTRTDGDGRYSFEFEYAGSYQVCFLPDSTVNLLRRCWRDETARFYGTPIEVPESGVVRGIDTTLAPGTSVTGRVTGWDGQPLAGICVAAWRPQAGGVGRAGDTLTSATGEYTIAGLIPGEDNRIVFNEPCSGGPSVPGLAQQWFDRQINYATATPVIAARSETRAGVDGILGPSAIPPEGVVPPRPPQCVVPRLRNRTFASARAALGRAGCSIPKPTLRVSRKLRRGYVISSRPAARKKVRRGRAVKLVVSRGR